MRETRPDLSTARRAAVLFEGEFDLDAATQRAIDILSRNPKGFFLMVESDLHTEDLVRGLDRTVAFDRAIGRTAERLAAPRWEDVVVLSGSGSGTAGPFDISEGAVQWKAEWRCERGSLQMTVDPPPVRPHPLAEGSCPGEGEGFSLQTGALRLVVEAAGRGRIVLARADDLIARHAGSLSGLYPKAYLNRLRQEWR